MVTTLSIFSNPNISVVFVLDESGSISSSNFQLETQGFINALDGLPTNGTVEVSVIGFSNNSEIVQTPIVLRDSNISSIKSKLEANSQNNGLTNMSGAINTASNLISSSLATTKVICLSTDGQPNNSSSATIAANNSKKPWCFVNTNRYWVEFHR